MTENDVFYTRTMAKVYTNQGNWKKAEKIYKYLLTQEPGQQDLIEALAEIETRQRDRLPDDITKLFHRWIDLLLLHHNLQKLLRLRTHLNSSR